MGGILGTSGPETAGVAMDQQLFRFWTHIPVALSEAAPRAAGSRASLPWRRSAIFCIAPRSVGTTWAFLLQGAEAQCWQGLSDVSGQSPFFFFYNSVHLIFELGNTFIVYLYTSILYLYHLSVSVCLSIIHHENSPPRSVLIRQFVIHYLPCEGNHGSQFSASFWLHCAHASTSDYTFVAFTLLPQTFAYYTYCSASCFLFSPSFIEIELTYKVV